MILRKDGCKKASPISPIFVFLQTMKAKLFILFFVALVSTQVLQAQNIEQDTETTGKTILKPDIRLSLGSSFSTLYPGMNGFSTWIAPEISMPINKKWTLDAGIAYTNFTLSGIPQISGYGSPVQNYGSVYVKGRYQVNNKLSIIGLAYKTLNLSPHKSKNKVNPRAIDFSNSGAMIDIDYKVNSHFRINAAFSVERYHYNPYTPYVLPGFGRGYYTAPAGPAVPGGFYQGF